MNDPQKSWKRLVDAARKAPAAPDESAPYGFSTRVAALAFAAQPPPQSAFARYSLRAVFVALALAAIAVGVNYRAIVGAFDDEPLPVANDDPIAEVVDMGS